MSTLELTLLYLLAAVLGWPVLRQLFGFALPTVGQWGAALALGALLLVLMRTCGRDDKKRPEGGIGTKL